MAPEIKKVPEIREIGGNQGHFIKTKRFFSVGQKLLLLFLPRIALKATIWPQRLNFDVPELRKYQEFWGGQKRKSS